MHARPEASAPGKDRASNTRGLVLDAARSLFAARGYAGTSLRQVADRVGIEVPSLYNHIDSKQQLLVELLEIGMAALTSAVTRGLSQVDGSQADRLFAASKAHVQFHCDHREQAVLGSQLVFVEGDSRDLVVSQHKQHEDLFKEVLTAGMASGEFRRLDVTLTCFAILGMGTSATEWFRPDGRLTGAQVGALYAEMGVRSVLSGHHFATRYGSDQS